MSDNQKTNGMKSLGNIAASLTQRFFKKSVNTDKNSEKGSLLKSGNQNTNSDPRNTQGGTFN